MADIFRSAMKKRMQETDAPTVVEGPINTHKRTMTQSEFTQGGAEDPRKKNQDKLKKLLGKK